MPFVKGKSGNESTKFTAENQPENRGRKGKSVTEWLNEYGEAKKLEFEVTITKAEGSPQTKKGKVESVTTINQLIAVTIINKAVQGDNKAITTFLDRTEGKPLQNIDVKSNGKELKQPIWGVVDPLLNNDKGDDSSE